MDQIPGLVLAVHRSLTVRNRMRMIRRTWQLKLRLCQPPSSCMSSWPLHQPSSGQ